MLYLFTWKMDLDGWNYFESVAKMKLILVVILWISNVNCHTEHLSLEERKFVKSGSVSIAGSFPIHVRGCGLPQFRPNYMALSQAMVYAIDRINNDSSLLPNTTLGYEIYDSCLIPRLAMETALEVVNRKKLSTMYERYSDQDRCLSRAHGLGSIPAMIGTGNSGSSILVTNLLQVESIPLISYAATSDKLSKVHAYPTFFRTVPPDRFQSQAMSDLACHFNWTYIAAIAEDNAYGRSGIDYLRKKISIKGTCLAMESYFSVDQGNETKTKISSIIRELKALKNVEVVVLYCTKSAALSVLDEAVKQSLPKKTWMASEGWGDTRTILQPRLLSAVKGLVGVVLPRVVLDSYVQYLMNLTPAYRPTHWWRDFWETQFDCSFTRPDGSIRGCTEKLRITRHLYNNKLHSNMAAYVINAVYAIAHALDAMNKCIESSGLLKDGKCPNIANNVDPEELLVYLKVVNFTSPVSQVSFDSNGDPAGSYTINNLQRRNGTWEFRKVGAWIAANTPSLDIDDDLLMWNGDSKGRIPKSICEDVCRPGFWQTKQVGCCWECISCPVDGISQSFGAKNCSKCSEDTIPNTGHTECLAVPIVRISYAHPFGLAFISFSCLGLLATASIAVVFVRHNDTPVVKATNRELTYMLLFCIAMCYLAPFIYLAEPSPVICVLVQIWFYVFYTTCIAILGAKTNKIVLLFEARVPRPKYSSGIGKYRHVLFVVSAMLVEFLIIIVWVSTDRPRPFINKSMRDSYIYTCKPTTHIAGRLCHYFLMSILILASLFCCYFAYKARNLPDNFNEGKFIAFSMYVLVISWVTFYPVFLNIQDIYTAVVLSVTTVVAASGLLVCMFLPKIYIIIWRPHKNTKLYMKEQLTRHAFRVDTMQTARQKQPQSPTDLSSSHTSNTRL